MFRLALSAYLRVLALVTIVKLMNGFERRLQIYHGLMMPEQFSLQAWPLSPQRSGNGRPAGRR